MEREQERAARFRAEVEEAAQVRGAARRREELLAWATGDGGLSREAAEEVYDLAAEEALAPAIALALARGGFLVRELVSPEPAEEAMQPDAPAWIRPAEPDAIAHERRLRASLRRLRHMLERCSAPGAAVDAYLAEPDVELRKAQA